MTHAQEDTLLAKATHAVGAAGTTLLTRFCTTPPPATLADLLAGIEAHNSVVEATLHRALLAALPGSSWAADEEEQGPLPDGECWVTDPADRLTLLTDVEPSSRRATV